MRKNKQILDSFLFVWKLNIVILLKATDQSKEYISVHAAFDLQSHKKEPLKTADYVAYSFFLMHVHHTDGL